jgi:type IV pilus assembly protein PilW
VLTLAVFSIMSTFEGKRRTMRSGADLDQAGGLAMFQIDQWVRSAGSGFTQAVTLDANNNLQPYAYGCQLYAAKSGAVLLPPPSTLPAPFDGVTATSIGPFRLAPALILPAQNTPSVSGQSSDMLVLMSSGSNAGEVPAAFSAAPTSNKVTLANTLPFQAGDMMLLANSDIGPGALGGPCMVTQVDAGFTGTTASTTVSDVNLSGSWYQSTIGSAQITNFPLSGQAIDLGSPTSTAPPSFQVIGVGDNNTLFSYDLLNISGTPLQARADSVFELHALYGVATGDDNTVGLWVKPDSTGSYSPATLSASNTGLKSIKALRVGLILRSALPERDVVNTSTSLTLFSDLGSTLTYTRTLSSAEQHYRYRTVEATIPLRNNSF